MYTCIDSVEHDLKCQLELRNRYKKQLYKLKQYEGYGLVLETRRNREEYYIYNNNESGKKLKYCNRKMTKQRKRIQVKRMLEESTHIIEENIAIMDYFLYRYRSINPEDIELNLPKAYRGLKEYAADVFGDSEKNKWIREQLTIKEQKGPFMPEELKHVTIDGTKCRSRAEVAIYNYLLQRGVAFVYEPYLQIEGSWLIPDFMFIDREGKKIIIEYLGMPTDDMYMNRQYYKIGQYIKYGWVPNINLILAFEDAKQKFDSHAITRVIELFL